MPTAILILFAALVNAKSLQCEGLASIVARAVEVGCYPAARGVVTSEAAPGLCEYFVWSRIASCELHQSGNKLSAVLAGSNGIVPAEFEFELANDGRVVKAVCRSLVSRLQWVRNGHRPEKVLLSLGEPQKKTRSGDFERWWYMEPCRQMGGGGGSRHFVEFESGRVSAVVISHELEHEREY